jgi:hypothetical protein
MIRNILDYQGNILGQLELPDDTPEEIWTQKLSPYAKPPPSPEEQFRQALSRKVEDSRKLADAAIDEFQQLVFAFFVENNIDEQMALLKSCWAHHRLRAVEIDLGTGPMIIDVLNLAITGSLETAWVVLGQMTPDDMSQPQHFFDQGWIDTFRNILGSKIGLS